MDAQERIKQQVTGNPVVLYMKGTPQFPQCGFSANAVQILKACGVEKLFTVKVLDHPLGLRRVAAAEQIRVVKYVVQVVESLSDRVTLSPGRYFRVGGIES